MRSVAAGVVLVVVLVVAAVSGCSAGDAAPAEVRPLASGAAGVEASTAPESTHAAEATPRHSESSSPGMAPGQAATPQEASAFARHYLDLVNAAFVSADARAVEAVSHTACEGCRNLIEAIKAPSESGERVEGGDFLVTFAEAREIAPGDALVDIRYQVAPIRVLDAAGEVVDTRPGTQAIDGQLRLLKGPDGWTVRGFRNAGS